MIGTSTLKVKVTREYLRLGDYNKPCQCPIAIALRSTYSMLKVNVGVMRVMFSTPKGKVYYYDLKRRDDRKAYYRSKFPFLRRLLGGFEVTLTFNEQENV